ncbi:aldo/keto reductase [Streptomyces sp. NPDC059455]|uniref:aldo/keto reductase n=1 Tax=Streptomyces sp. NPDC059455 TaxID=3346837 RepID=UPI003678219C
MKTPSRRGCSARPLRGIERSSYVLATKVGRYGDDTFDFTAERVRRSVHENLSRLGTDHLDLVQCHDIEFGALDQIADETLPALRELQDAGLVRSVGSTGYPLDALRHVADRAAVDNRTVCSRVGVGDGTGRPL